MTFLLKNKKLSHNYLEIKNYFAGMVLFGFEVKSLKNKKGSFEGSYISEKQGELFLKNFYIPPYQEKNTPDSYDSYRDRKILLKKDEIEEILKESNSSGIAIIPKKIFLKNNFLKMEIVLARGAKKFDKREKIKKRDEQREIGRKLKKGI